MVELIGPYPCDPLGTVFEPLQPPEAVQVQEPELQLVVLQLNVPDRGAVPELGFAVRLQVGAEGGGGGSDLQVSQPVPPLQMTYPVPYWV